MPAFTLLEVLVSMGLSSILALTSVAIGLNWYHQARAQQSESTYSFASAFVELQSLEGICQHEGCIAAEAHGFHVVQNSLQLFEGASFENQWPTTAREVPFDSMASNTQALTTIYFPDGSKSSTAP